MTEKITTADLRDHCTDKSAWIAIRGKVYDVTAFIARHPGGKDALRYAIGRDATTVFESYHNVESVQHVLWKQPIVGELAASDMPVFVEQSEFHKAISEKVRKRLRDAGLDEKHSHKASITYIAIVLTLIVSYYQQYFGSLSNSLLAQVVCTSVFGFGCAQVGLYILHDMCHFSYTHNPLVWRLIGAIHDIVNGCSFIKWTYRHVFGHHPYTNIVDFDPDIYVMKDRGNWRLFDFQPYYTIYRYQHIYAPFLYGFLFLKVRIQDIKSLYIVKSHRSIAINPLTLSQHIQTLGGKVFFVFYRILLPVMLGYSWTRVIALFLISDFILSWYLAIIFQANHVVEGVDLPIARGESVDWAKLQIRTTMDYAPRSLYTRIIVGALNFQTVHHLFPGILQQHYPLLQDIIYEECQKHGVKYNTSESLGIAVGSHFNILKKMGAEVAGMNGHRKEQ